jgi:hypothetical protein
MLVNDPEAELGAYVYVHVRSRLGVASKLNLKVVLPLGLAYLI